MIAQTRHLRKRTLQLLDGLFYASALLLAYWLRASLSWWSLPELESFEKYLWLSPLPLLLGPVFLSRQSLYDARPQWSSTVVALRILRASAYLVVSLVLVLFLVREQYARSVVILAGALGACFVYLRHELTLAFEKSRPGSLRLRTLWLGAENEVASLEKALSATERHLLETVGSLSPASASGDALKRLLHERSVNLVVLVLDSFSAEERRALLAACEQEGVEVILRPGMLTTSPYRLNADVFAGEPVFHLRAQNAAPGRLFLKQALDYALAAALLVLLSPLLLAVAAAIRLGSPGPALFRQRRTGLHGRPFTMLKFRSMRPDAEQARESLENRNEMTGPAFKLRDDPRVTPLGRFLRRHSLDELPQLWNVLRGEMSLVGPRPLPTEETRRIGDDAQRRRLSVKPGLTCLWQIGGRNDIADFDDWVRLDLQYIDQWSLWLDLRILLATIPVALFGRGGR